jgi:hypothetical protein
MASRCGTGSRSSRSSSGPHSWCKLAYASSISDSTPTARTTVRSDSDADAIKWVQQRRLADPGLSPQHERPALAAANRRDQVVQQRALTRSAAQAGRSDWTMEAAEHRLRRIVNETARSNEGSVATASVLRSRSHAFSAARVDRVT